MSSSQAASTYHKSLVPYSSDSSPQVGLRHLGLALNVPQRSVTRVAQQPSDALSARTQLRIAAPMIMIYDDPPPLFKRLAAHRTGVPLLGKHLVKAFRSQPVSLQPVLSRPSLTSLRSSTPTGPAGNTAVSPLAFHIFRRTAVALMPSATCTLNSLPRHPFTAKFRFHVSKVHRQ